MPYGLLFFFESGTNTDKTTFADVNETIANPQPLILNGDGSVPNCFYSGSAKVKLVTNAGTPTAPIEGVQQWERDPVTSGSVGAIGRDWDAISSYDFGSVVIFNNLFYVSIINNNQNNLPNSTPTAWTQFNLLKQFNTNETYNLSDPVIATDLTIYISRIASNLGNDPASSPAEWVPSGAGGALLTIITASDPTFVPNVLTRSIRFTAVGAGGGGGGFEGAGAGTGGCPIAGGAGSTSIKMQTPPDPTYAIVIGAGGAGGAAGSNIGATGGSTTVAGDTIGLNVGGGFGGNAVIADAATVLSTPAAGGIATGGDLNLNGAQSLGVSRANGVPTPSMSGASTQGGGKGSTIAANGLNASVFGEGGGTAIVTGASGDFAGGAGFSGVVIVEEFF